MEFVIILFVLLVVGLIVYGLYAAAHRRKTLEAWARARGLAFRPDSAHDFDERFPRFDCLRQGSDRYAYNLLEGAWEGRPFLGFDYHYTTHSTDSKGNRQDHNHHFSGVIERSSPRRPP